MTDKPWRFENAADDSYRTECSYPDATPYTIGVSHVDGDVEFSRAPLVENRETFTSLGVEWFHFTDKYCLPEHSMVHVLLYRYECGVAVEQGVLEIETYYLPELNTTNAIGWRYADGHNYDAEDSAPPFIYVDTVYDQREMVAADNYVHGIVGGDPESKQERSYREKQEALQKAEHDRNQEQARRLREAGEVLSRDYTQPHDHKLGWLR